MAHEQDGHPRRAHDPFGIAAHHQSGDAAAAVGPEHDQVGAALFRLFDDYVGDRMTHRFAEHGLTFYRVLNQDLEAWEALTRSGVRPV